MDPDAPGPSLEALTLLADARPPRPRPDGRPCRPVEHVPPAGRRSRRPRSSSTTRPTAGSSSASAPAGSRASTSRSGSSCRRSAERIDRFVSAVDTLRALWSPSRRRAARRDPRRPVLSAGRGESTPRRRGRRADRRSSSAARARAASALAARVAAGWLQPGVNRRRRGLPRREAGPAPRRARGRGPRPGRLRHRGQVRPGGPPTSRAEALVAAARALVEVGATHVVLGMPAGPGAGRPRRRRGRGPRPAPRGRRMSARIAVRRIDRPRRDARDRAVRAASATADEPGPTTPAPSRRIPPRTTASATPRPANRGLAAPYIAGGRGPGPREGRARTSDASCAGS